MPTDASPVQLPVSCTPGTGVPLLLSSVRVTSPPTPLTNEEGWASRINPPLALIGADLLADPAVNVRVGPPVPPLDAAMPVVVTLVMTHPELPVAFAVVPAPLTPSTEPEPTPRLLKLNPKVTPGKGLPSAS